MMKICPCIWKTINGVSLENDMIKVVVLPKLGGKTVSVYHKKRGFELVAQSSSIYRTPKDEALFCNYDASGLDEAFPTIDPVVFEWNGGEISYPDHGEIWRGKFSCDINSEDVYLCFESEKFPYKYEKTVSLDNDSVGYHYKITSTQDKPFPCLWAFHGLVRYEEDMELIYPNGANEFINVFESRELGLPGEIYPLHNWRYNFKKVPGKSSGTMIKYYVRNEVGEGKCGYLYPTQKMLVEMTYDHKLLPYLGMWITAGGFRGDFNCAFEPANGYYDDIYTAKSNGKLFFLERENPLEFSINIRLSAIK